MNINIKATGMELTTAIQNYVNKKVQSLERFINNKDSHVYVEVGKTTMHHKNGEFYKAEISLNVAGDTVFASTQQSNLYTAIDYVREEVCRTITNKKDRKQTLFTRGARSVKKMFKGLSSRDPLTSKY